MSYAGIVYIVFSLEIHYIVTSSVNAIISL